MCGPGCICLVCHCVPASSLRPLPGLAFQPGSSPSPEKRGPRCLLPSPPETSPLGDHGVFRTALLPPPPVGTAQARTCPCDAVSPTAPEGRAAAASGPPLSQPGALHSPGLVIRHRALLSPMGRPGWGAWGGSCRRARRALGGRENSWRGAGEGRGGWQCPLHIHSPPRDPCQLASPTGLALPLLPLPSITPCQHLPAPPLHCPLFCSHPLPSPFPIPLPHSLLSSAILSFF